MQIAKFYSHLNGWEHIQVHKPNLWGEIQAVIAGVNAADCLTKVSLEKRTQGKVFYSPVDMNTLFKTDLERRGWTERRTSYFVTDDQMLILRTMRMTAEQQKQEILAAEKTAIFSYSQTELIKDRVRVEVQFGRCAFPVEEMFGNPMALFSADVTDVSLELLPTKALLTLFPFTTISGENPLCYEYALDALLKQGCNSPPVPLVVIGVES